MYQGHKREEIGGGGVSITKLMDYCILSSVHDCVSLTDGGQTTTPGRDFVMPSVAFARLSASSLSKDKLDLANLRETIPLPESPLASSPGPAESFPGPAEFSLGPAESSPGPAESSPGPAESSPGPAESSPSPAESSPGPAESSTPVRNFYVQFTPSSANGEELPGSPTGSTPPKAIPPPSGTTPQATPSDLEREPLPCTPVHSSMEETVDNESYPVSPLDSTKEAPGRVLKVQYTTYPN